MKIKHLLTLKCHVGCGYCLEKNVKVRQVNSPLYIAEKYDKLYEEGYTSLDMTGGEPTMHKNFIDIALAAANIFDEVHLYTADHTQYNLPLVEEIFTTVNYGWHNKTTQPSAHELPEVKVGIPVYVQTMDIHYSSDLPSGLAEKGFLGLSINTNKHLPDYGFYSTLPIVDGFSIKVNDNNCYAHSNLLMPDLTITSDVGQYLDKNIA